MPSNVLFTSDTKYVNRLIGSFYIRSHVKITVFTDKPGKYERYYDV